jgi:iron complex transport system permease protein
VKLKGLHNLWLILGCLLLLWLDLAADTADWAGQAFVEFRLPRVGAAIFAGIALSVCGLILQTIFRNPLAGPFLTGVSPGASFTVALFTLAFPSILTAGFGGFYPGLAFCGMLGGVLVLLLQLYISARYRSVFTLLLTGVLLGYLFGAGVEIMQGLAGAEQLKSFTMWGLGSFDRVQTENLASLFLIGITGLLFVLFNRFRLDAYLPGDEYAQISGVDVKKLKFQSILVSGILAGMVTGLCGPIGFVGMVSPHLARALAGKNSHGNLLIPTILSGVFFCLLADWAAHHAIPGTTLNVNAVSSLLGAPLVLWAVLKIRN